jgi:hypothetical protein
MHFINASSIFLQGSWQSGASVRAVWIAVLIGGVALAGCVPAPPPIQPVRWLVYGDSLSEQAVPYLTQYGTVGDRYLGGTAPCDWTGQLPQDATHWAPQEVLIQFSGNLLTSCTVGQDPTTLYVNSVTTIANFWRGRGVPVTIVISPPKPDDSEAFARNAELTVASLYGYGVKRADQAVLDNGQFAYFLPCLSPTEDGCGTDPAGVNLQPGMIRVRSTDGIHFGTSSTDGYSSGAYRFAKIEAGGTLSAPTPTTTTTPTSTTSSTSSTTTSTP